MSNENFVGTVLALLLLYALVKILIPKSVLSLGWHRKKHAAKHRRSVPVDPLLIEERRLAAKLQRVRAEIRHRQDAL